MSAITTVELNLAKNVFQAQGVAASGRAFLRKKLRRYQVLALFGQLPPYVVAKEAHGGAHVWGRENGNLGHEERLIPSVSWSETESGDQRWFREVGACRRIFCCPRQGRTRG